MPEWSAPDLVITDFWEEDGAICYQLQNIGTAPSSPGHQTALIANGVTATTDVVEQTLLPGERYDGVFAYDWSPLDPETTFIVSADHDDMIVEADETNNSREETWRGDTIPPEIISGPSVSGVTQDSATVSWHTNELTIGLVQYSTRADIFTDSHEEVNSFTEHSVVLQGLTPATTYQYVVQAIDSSGNSRKSRIATFETLPAPDTEDPEVSLLTIEEWEGIMPFSAEATDDTGIEKVEFYMDGTILFADYSPPFTFYVDTSQFENGVHTISSRSFDNAGNSSESQSMIDIINAIDTTAPWVSITNPTNNEYVSGEIFVTADVTDDTGISQALLAVDAWMKGQECWQQPYPKAATTQLKLDTTSLDNGKHRIAVIVYDNELNVTTATVDIVVENTPPPPPPKLVITKREVTRTNNYFTIKLTVKNTGGSNATNITIKDNLLGFQPISATSVEAEYTPEFNISSQCSDCIINVTGDIPPGLTQTYSYYAVPILHQSSGMVPMIGNYSELEWSAGTPVKFYNWEQVPAPKTTDGKLIQQSYEEATKTADYLIVTSPLNLFRFNPAEDVNQLLSSMAELAKIKFGVLGYLDVPVTIPYEYGYGDQIAAGIIHPVGTLYYTPTIAVGDANSGKLWIRINTPVGFKTKEVDAGFNGEGFEKGDALTIGQDAYTSEILMGDGSAHRILLYNCVYDETTGFFAAGNYDEWPASFNSGDGLAAGDVTGNSLGEVIIAEKGNDSINIYDHNGNKLSTFPITYDEGDCLVVGDVSGDDKDEIVIADKSEGKIYVYSGSSLLTSFGTFFGDSYELAIADIGWGNKEEILIGYDVSSSYSEIEIYDGMGKSLDKVPYDYYGGDGLVGCDFLGEGKEQIIIGSVEDDNIYIYPISAQASDPYVLWELIQNVGDASSYQFQQGWGGWSSKLTNNWAHLGYMLIVGETEIVPAYSPDFGTTPGGHSLNITATDWLYASTSGYSWEPNLSIGRIIGNNAKELKRPIDTSINVTKQLPGYSFDRTSSLGIAGYPKSIDGDADDIDPKPTVYNIQAILNNQGVTTTVINNPDYTAYDSSGTIDINSTAAMIRSQFYYNIQGKDIIHLAAHGTPHSWDTIDLSDIWNKGKLFGSKNPFIYADSCSTAKFVGDTSMAEAFLQDYAGAYFGATHIGIAPWEFELTKKIFNKWDAGESIGHAVEEGKYYLNISTGDSTWNKKIKLYLRAVFNLFGDPKFGVGGPAAQTLSGTIDAATEPLSTIDIEVPDINISRINGADYVEIPNGFTLYEPGKPQVPGYQVFYKFPTECHVQDINLVSRSEPEIRSGLLIPNTVISIPGEPSPVQLSTDEEIDHWPDDIFTWDYEEGTDENTLIITVFPFVYNPLTLQARFYQNFSFDIEYTQSDVRIAGLTTDKSVYTIGERVKTTVEFGDGQPGEIPPTGREIVASYRIIDICTGEITGGSTIDTLKDFHGNAAFSATWDSTGSAPGYYQIDFELRDTNGDLIDHSFELFRLGTPLGEITEMTGTPQQFTVGQSIDIDMTFTNLGTTDLSGTALVWIEDENDQTVAEYSEEFGEIPPSSAAVFADIWDTAGVPEGVYRVNGLVFYNGGGTQLASIIVYTSLPPVADAGPDQIVEFTGQDGTEVLLDGSNSYDPADFPLTFIWAWDGQSEEGESPTAVLPPGTTTVTLTVSNGLESDTDTTRISVVDTTPPQINLTVPGNGHVVQGNVTIAAEASDLGEVTGVYFWIRESDENGGVPIGYEAVPASLSSGNIRSGEWTYQFDTEAIPDGYYLLRAKAVDYFGNEAWSNTSFNVSNLNSNCTVTGLLPSSEDNKAGRTVPVKFSVKIAEDVTQAQPFVYNEELEIRIYDASDSGNILQTSVMGDSAQDYRIDTTGELYITNFKTAKKPAEYMVEIWWPNKNFLVGSFTFETVK